MENHAFEFRQMAEQSVAYESGSFFVIRMRATFGFSDDAINTTELLQIRGCDLERLSCQFFFRGVTPHNRGAALGRNYRIDRVLHHQNAICDGDPQRAATAAFSGNYGDNWHFQTRHLAKIARDRLGLSSLFCAKPGISARS